MQPLPRWCSGQGCGAQSLRSENRFLAWAPSPLNNHKVSWLKSERKGLGKIEKSRWCSGDALRLKGEGRFPAWPRVHLRWFQSGRNRLRRMKKVWLFSNWHGGVIVKAVVYEAQGERIDSQLELKIYLKKARFLNFSTMIVE